MANADTEVECPICGGTFDPTAAGGWCTNPDCGEWQYEADTESDEGIDQETDDRDDADSSAADEFFDEADQLQSETDEPESEAIDDPEETAEADVEADDPAEPAEGDAEDEPELDETEETDTAGDPDADEAVEAVADDGEPAEDGDTEPEPEPSADSAASEETAEEPATIACPDCGTELDGDANFCIECGADVQDVESGDDELTACPDCGTDLDGDEHFCANCGEDLDAHRGASEEPPEEQDADAVEALAAQTDDQDAPTPESLVLAVLGTEIEVADGDRVGREVRAALTDAGRPEDEAVRIHREHVRFVREADSFYLVDLGDNPTKLNGRSLQKGDREPVGPGDELELSGVATVSIEAP